LPLEGDKHRSDPLGLKDFDSYRVISVHLFEGLSSVINGLVEEKRGKLTDSQDMFLHVFLEPSPVGTFCQFSPNPSNPLWVAEITHFGLVKLPCFLPGFFRGVVLLKMASDPVVCIA